MKLRFYKYQAAGNDFVVVDNRDQQFFPNPKQASFLCDRRFGVGADGVILVDRDNAADFSIRYYNPDGTQSLCGNGCRSAVALARQLGLAGTASTFSAYDGIHKAEWLEDKNIRIQMNDVGEVKTVYDGYYLDTGSPHFVRFVKSVEDYPVVEEGRKLRYDTIFPHGANANFVEVVDDHTLTIRTYERGVEQETLACGTGATATAIAATFLGMKSPITLKARGGILNVAFDHRPNGFTNIYLSGPAKLVFEGQIELPK